MNWDEAIKQISPHVVKIETPDGFGTGFLAFYNDNKTWCGIATAAHVVSHADLWQQPIRVHHEGSKRPRFLNLHDRVIMVDYSTDSAVVLFPKGDLELPQIPIALLPAGQPCGIGIDVGWLGYPTIEPHTLCFFAGTVSARQSIMQTRSSYLIDGVAINGVSGGPVFHCRTPNDNMNLNLEIIGTVSAYQANRARGEVLPGLLRAQDVSHFHDVMQYVRDIEEANRKKAEFDAKQQATAGTAPTFSSSANQPTVLSPSSPLRSSLRS
jgi:hypothetical protein